MAEASLFEVRLEMSVEKWPTFGLFGHTLASDFSFESNLLPGNSIPELSFTCVSEPPIRHGRRESNIIFVSAERTGDGEHAFVFYRQEDYDLLHFAGRADFYLCDDQILCHILDSAHTYMVEICLLGIVLSVWMERQGQPALHASAIAYDDQAVAFLSNNGGGKSSLAATLMQAGHPLLCDDILTVTHVGNTTFGHPGYPQIRLWPEEAKYFLGYYQRLQCVYPGCSKRRVPVGGNGLGRFFSESIPIKCLYLLERCDRRAGEKTTEILPLSPLQAIVELIRHSFIPQIVDALGLRRRCLDFFARLSRYVPMRRLVYPTGLENLSHVRERILEDLSGF